MAKSITCKSIVQFAFLALMLLSGFAVAETSAYQAGHEALEVFNKEAMPFTPMWVQVWVLMMAASFFAGLFFVKNHVAARWVVGGFLAGIVIVSLATRVFGLPGLSGLIALGHLIGWSPALYHLLTSRPFAGERSAFTIWAGWITFVIVFSFIFDIRDAFIYLRHMLF